MSSQRKRKRLNLLTAKAGKSSDAGRVIAVKAAPHPRIDFDGIVKKAVQNALTESRVPVVNGSAKPYEVTAANGPVGMRTGPDQDPPFVHDYESDGRAIIQRVAQNIMQPTSSAVPTAAQVEKCGGGIGGYLRALRSLQRGETI